MAPTASWVAWLGEVVRAMGSEPPAAISVAGVGPPEGARSFAELILGRSRLERAPPARG